MADTAAETRAAEAYYTTSRALGTGTTSTVTMQIWRLLSDHLLQHQAPMSGTELAQATGLSIEQIEEIFNAVYYQKHYGFKRFDSYETWKDWAMSTGVLYNPALHDPKPQQDPAADGAALENGEETEEQA